MHKNRAVVLGLSALVGALAFAAACSESVETTRPDAGVAGGEAGAGDAGASSGSSSGSSDSGKIDAPLDNPDGLQINEISPKGAEWVELVNLTGQPKDISGWKVADAEKDGGGPKIAEALVFPAGTTLAPAEYVVVVASSPDGGACPGPAGTKCHFASFGISASKGERIYLLRPNDSVASGVDLPPDAVTVDTDTWSRLPNGSGPFAVGAATPGAPNRAK